MNTPDKTIALIDEFLRVVDLIYGVYLDSTKGFFLGLKQLIETQERSIEVNKDSTPELATIEYHDSLHFYYGKGEPGKPGSVILHKCTQGELKRRNEKGGDNYKFIGNMCLVSIYQYWEDHYRSAIAESLQLEKEEILISVMGDLRFFRRSIIHHKGIALAEVEKCELLKWFKTNDEVFIDESKMEDIIFHIQKGVVDFIKQLDSSPA
jgi:hypothetical protein